MFDRIVGHLSKLGSVRMDAVKTSINLAAKSHFAGVTPLKNSINISFIYDKDLDDPRIVNTIKLSDSSYAYRIKLISVEDIDDQFLGWLEYAYNLKSGSK